MDEKSAIAVPTDNQSKSIQLAKPMTKPTNVVQQNIQIAGSNGIVFGNVIHNNLNYTATSVKSKDDNNAKEKECIVKNMAEIKIMQYSTEPLNEEAITVISKHMDENWKDFARKIKFSDGQIHQFHEDHYIRGLKEVIYQMLLEWKQSAMPNLGDTVKLLWKTGHKQVVQLLYDEYWVLKKDQMSH